MCYFYIDKVYQIVFNDIAILRRILSNEGKVQFKIPANAVFLLSGGCIL